VPFLGDVGVRGNHDAGNKPFDSEPEGGGGTFPKGRRREVVTLGKVVRPTSSSGREGTKTGVKKEETWCKKRRLFNHQRGGQVKKKGKQKGSTCTGAAVEKKPVM